MSIQAWHYAIRGLALPFKYYATAQQNGYLTNRFKWKSKTMTMAKGLGGQTPAEFTARALFLYFFLLVSLGFW